MGSGKTGQPTLTGLLQLTRISSRDKIDTNVRLNCILHVFTNAVKSDKIDFKKHFVTMGHNVLTSHFLANSNTNRLAPDCRLHTQFRLK